jgi:hypothetical protein
MVRRRGRLREGLDAVELVTRPMRGGPVRGSALQLLNSIKAVGRSRILVEAAPHLAGAVFLSCGMADQGSLVGRGRILGRRAEYA